MISFPGGSEAHNDKAGQRSSLEESSARWLDSIEHSERPCASQVAKRAGQRVAGWGTVVPELADGNQGRQSVADNGKAEPVEPLLRKRSQLEGKLHDAPPGDWSTPEFARQSEH